MTKKDIKINITQGIHVRIACEIIQTTKKFDGGLTMINGKSKADCKTPLVMLVLNGRYGDVVEVIATCESERKEQELLNEIAEILGN